MAGRLGFGVSNFDAIALLRSSVRLKNTTSRRSADSSHVQSGLAAATSRASWFVLAMCARVGRFG
jgi:hypothetical protein